MPSQTNEKALEMAIGLQELQIGKLKECMVVLMEGVVTGKIKVC